MGVAQYRDKDARRAYNREYYDRQMADPAFRAARVARQKDYRANRASPEALENERLYKKLDSQRRRVWRRALTIDHYGGACACCGEDREFFLTIDHINNDGNEHRKATKMWGISDWLSKNDWPEGFQVLCYNCNAAKYRFGECPCEGSEVG